MDGQGFLILLVVFPILIVVLLLLKLIQPRKSLAHEKYEIEKNNILTNLPADVLEQITKRLSLNDYLALRETCHSCRKTISNAIKNTRCCHSPEMPQVFLQSKNSWFFFSLSKKSVHHHLRTPPPQRLTHTCIGSVEGWLIMSDYSEVKFEKIFFLNPVTDVRIMIPSKLPMPSNFEFSINRIKRVRKMVASSKPNCGGSSDCYLAGLLSDRFHIAIYKLFDKSWTIVESDKGSRSFFKDIEIIGTKLYVSDTPSKSILIYCLKDTTSNGPPKVKVLAKYPTIDSSEHFFSFLAKDEALRELYFITMLFNEQPVYETQHVMPGHLKSISAFPEPPQATNFQVFMLDTNKDPIEWQSVKLEDRVAFVSHMNSIVMPRDELNFNKDLIRGNSIYFAFYSRCPTNPWSGLQLGMFCLTDRSIKYFPVETSKHDDDDVPFPRWFVPSLL